MKESDIIRAEMNRDDSDKEWRTVSYFRKIERSEKKERFIDNVLPKIREKHEVEFGEIKSLYDGKVYPDTNKVIIKTAKFGEVHYYPKSGSLYFKRRKNWIKKYGMRWIKKYLINS